jgi:hypothetical protein
LLDAASVTDGCFEQRQRQCLKTTHGFHHSQPGAPPTELPDQFGNPACRGGWTHYDFTSSLNETQEHEKRDDTTTRYGFHAAAPIASLRSTMDVRLNTKSIDR